MSNIVSNISTQIDKLLEYQKQSINLSKQTNILTQSLLGIEKNYQPIYEFFYNKKYDTQPKFISFGKSAESSAAKYLDGIIQSKVNDIVNDLNNLLSTNLNDRLIGNYIKDIKKRFYDVKHKVEILDPNIISLYFRIVYNKEFLIQPHSYLHTKNKITEINYDNLLSDRKNKFAGYLEVQKNKIIEYIKHLFYLYLDNFMLVGISVLSDYIDLNAINQYFDNENIEDLVFTTNNFYKSTRKTSFPPLANEPQSEYRVITPIPTPSNMLNLSPLNTSYTPRPSSPSYTLQTPPHRPLSPAPGSRSQSPTPSYLKPTASSISKERSASPTRTGIPFK